MGGKTIAVLTACLAVWTAGAAFAQAPVEALTRSGRVRGEVVGDVAAFKGLPFAAPPVGPLRWRPPQPAPAWTGVRPATAFGPSCLQSGGVFSMAPAGQSEDCLTLNIWTPARRGAGRLPVMVWIYGGGFIVGSSAMPYYDGTAFARDGVVLVSLNYRLGRLGFFAHPALARRAQGEPLGNYGLMDQIAALRWVKDNIAAFGGDPARVTVFGESAGAISVNLLMTSPLAKGLFQKAIAESGFGRYDPPPLAQMQALGADYARTLGVEGDGEAAAAALRALPAERLLGDIKGLADPGVPRPMRDGVLVSESVDKAFAEGKEAKVPYLLGGNSFEASLFAGPISADPQTVIRRLGPDPKATTALFGGGDPLKAAFAISTDSLILEPDRDLARLHRTAGAPAFVYYFSYVPAARRALVPGAAHGSEIGYVFDTLPLKPLTLGTRTIPAATEEDLAVARAMHAYWTAFAKTGAPGAAGGPPWPLYDERTDELMSFDASGPQVRERLFAPQLDAVEAAADRREARSASSPP